ncbi:hypothetical protein D3C87_1985450 [compost metagenome]
MDARSGAIRYSPMSVMQTMNSLFAAFGSKSAPGCEIRLTSRITRSMTGPSAMARGVGRIVFPLRTKSSSPKY